MVKGNDGAAGGGRTEPRNFGSTADRWRIFDDTAHVHIGFRIDGSIPFQIPPVHQSVRFQIFGSFGLSSCPAVSTDEWRLIMMQTSEKASIAEEAVQGPVVIPVEAYVSHAYARAESDKLWGKGLAGRLPRGRIPKVGDYVTYDILEESIIVVRSAPDKISAYYNVCQHRGRRLTEGCGQPSTIRLRLSRLGLGSRREEHVRPRPRRLGQVPDAGKPAAEGSQGRHLGRLGLDQYGPKVPILEGLPRARRVDVGRR